MTSRAGFDGTPGAWYRPIRCFGSFRTSRTTFDPSFYMLGGQCLKYSVDSDQQCFKFLALKPFPVTSSDFQDSFASHCSCAHKTCSMIIIIHTTITIIIDNIICTSKFTRMGKGQSSYFGWHQGLARVNRWTVAEDGGWSPSRFLSICPLMQYFLTQKVADQQKWANIYQFYILTSQAQIQIFSVLWD